MRYWKTPQEMGLTQKQITEKLDELWKEALTNAHNHCHDCNAAPGKVHMRGCDVARCMNCKGQALSCNCKDNGEDVWDGLWPGTKECYDNRLLSYSDDTGWMFDYNSLRRLRIDEKAQ